jgi:AcrR family transcriptional regulator
MSYRVITNTKEDVIKAVIKIGAKKGANHVTMRDVAKACDISTFKVIDFFSTKKGYLDAAAQSIDVPYMERTVSLVGSGLSQIEIFNRLLDSFLSEPNKALFYLSYTNDFGFDPTTKNERQAIFLKNARVFFKDKQDKDDDYILLLWDYITSMLFYYAEKIIHGYLNNDKKTRDEIIEIVFKGIE